MNEPAPEAVVFDMDGLLLDSEGRYLEGFRQARDALGLAPDDALFLQMIGTNHESGGRLLRQAMGPAAEPFRAAWHEANQVLFEAPVPLKPTVRASVDALAARGVPMIVATSTPAEAAAARLAAAGLGDALTRIVGGDQVVRGKPDPEIFLTAADRIGVRPAACAAFEDSANGVRAAVAAGMIVTQVPDLVPPDAALLTLGHRVHDDLRSGLQALGLL